MVYQWSSVRSQHTGCVMYVAEQGLSVYCLQKRNVTIAWLVMECYTQQWSELSYLGSYIYSCQRLYTYSRYSGMLQLPILVSLPHPLNMHQK